jgi:hypothetical protein
MFSNSTRRKGSGNGPRRADAFTRRLRLQPHHAQVRAALAGDGEQRFDIGARQGLGLRRRIEQRRQK